LRAFVQGECCNAQPGDECLFSIRGSSACLVLARSRRCRWFEEAVLPLAARNPSERIRRLYPDAAEAYRKLHRELDGIINPEPTRFCSCGNPLSKQKRLCQACAKARKKESTRRRVTKHRMAVLCNASVEKSIEKPQ